MKDPIFPALGGQLRRARTDRRLTQPQLAARLGRDRARISELERDLIGNRLGRDRLTLLVEICDALDMVPVLVPRDRAVALRAEVDTTIPDQSHSTALLATFDNVFIDLGEEEEDDEG
jgi:transcriptional regulator with XRE-family HTH domain